MTGSGYLSASQDKMHSSFDSVQQQTGLFAGKGGYDIRVGDYTQLDGAVIGSTAGADKNRLDTGTLGFSNIDNRAEFSVSHSGIGLSASPSLSMSDMLKSAALTGPSALMSMGRGGNAGSTTYAAVSDGALIIRNQAGQQQDIAALSRDVAHANNALSPIFDKEKEQKRLQTAQMVGELGAQVMDVIRTEGEIRAVRAAEAGGKVDRPADNATEKEWEKYKKDLTQTADYKAVMQSYGTGSDLQRAAQAATAAIQALAGGGNLQQALAGASAPYLAQLVKDVTMPADEKKATASDIAANAMGHALMGAVVAQLSGKDAVAGAVGAAGGELTARLLIMQNLYSGRDTSDLTEAEKQSVSALASLAAGLASGIASGNTTGAATGAQAGRNAIENNFLNKGRPVAFAEKLKACNGEPSCEQGVRKDMAKESAENIQKLKSCWDAGDSACVAAMRSQIETDGKTYAQLGVQDALAGRSYENSANWYADIIDQCGGKCGWLESALTKTAADGLTDAVYGALGTGSLPKPGQTAEPASEIAGTRGVSEKGSVANANFAQSKIRANETFSAEGVAKYSQMAGQPVNNVDDLANAIRSGLIKPSQLSVDYVEMNGTKLILNTRTSVALDRAGIPKSDWYGTNQTNVNVPGMDGKTYNDLAADQLMRNKLPETGSSDIPRGRK